MKRIAFDIETAPDPEKVADMPEPEVAIGNIKDPEKIEAKIKEARAKQIGRAALDPYFARVLAIATALRDPDESRYEDYGDASLIVESEARCTPEEIPSTDDAERELLSWFWEQLRRGSPSTQIVTYNGCGFDVPFLMQRSLLLGVRPVLLPIHKYKCAEPDAEHLDLMLFLDQWNVGPCHPHSLQFYVRTHLKERPSYGEELEKGELGRLYDAGQIAKVTEVCGWDAAMTLKLAEKVVPHFAGIDRHAWQPKGARR